MDPLFIPIVQENGKMLWFNRDHVVCIEEVVGPGGTTCRITLINNAVITMATTAKDLVWKMQKK